MADYINTNMIQPSSYPEYVIVTGSYPAGYNIYYLPTPTTYPRGSMMWIETLGGAIAIDNSNPSAYAYCDLEWWNFMRLNSTENWGLYFRMITNTSTGTTTLLTTTKSYTLPSKNFSSTGSLQMSAVLTCDGSTSASAQQVITVTDGKTFHMLRDSSKNIFESV